ncbi:DUF1702 family protein [Plantactinospora soyae]|uniref:DUF1702 family protein n=1 Tax=Plantactinospora soyae TaxID=1544732 RepID=UPI00178A43DF
MSNSQRKSRARLFTPNRAMTRGREIRGFHVADEAARARLEAVGADFLDGFQFALEDRDTGGAGHTCRPDSVEERP